MPASHDWLRKISGVVIPTSPEEAKQSINSILPVDYRLFLVNEGDHDLTNIDLYTGGFEGADDKLVELNRVTRPLGELRRGDAVLIEELDIGILDFVLWYHLDLSFADDAQIKSWFQINKAYSLRESRYCPVLKTEGFYFQLQPRASTD